MITSWLMVICTDPGTPPEEWQRQMTAAVARGESVPICRRSGLYKPPRSHFDSVTERLTLNMDHFCPWVVNTVGFYNRKFFMLFLVYTNLTLFVCLISLVAQVAVMWDYLHREDVVRRWFPSIVNLVFYIGAIVIDALLMLTLVPFTKYHLTMACHNETTLEGNTNSKYDVGVRHNLQSVFGRRLWTWPLPFYLHGPDGDGVHWPSIDRAPVRTSSSTTVVPRGRASEGVRTATDIDPRLPPEAAQP
uniref:Palmitoyltransferase n=1 Tax=Haptolina brevifila TaxID=156173 RepID=A0A7S2NA50_9EUKA